jgi:hypothetical protein
MQEKPNEVTLWKGDLEALLLIVTRRLKREEEVTGMEYEKLPEELSFFPVSSVLTKIEESISADDADKLCMLLVGCYSTEEQVIESIMANRRQHGFNYLWMGPLRHIHVSYLPELLTWAEKHYASL